MDWQAEPEEQPPRKLSLVEARQAAAAMADFIAEQPIFSSKDQLDFQRFCNKLVKIHIANIASLEQRKK